MPPRPMSLARLRRMTTDQVRRQHPSECEHVVIHLLYITRVQIPSFHPRGRHLPVSRLAALILLKVIPPSLRPNAAGLMVRRVSRSTVLSFGG